MSATDVNRSQLPRIDRVRRRLDAGDDQDLGVRRGPRQEPATRPGSATPRRAGATRAPERGRLEGRRIGQQARLGRMSPSRPGLMYRTRTRRTSTARWTGTRTCSRWSCARKTSPSRSTSRSALAACRTTVRPNRSHLRSSPPAQPIPTDAFAESPGDPLEPSLGPDPPQPVSRTPTSTEVATTRGRANDERRSGNAQSPVRVRNGGDGRQPGPLRGRLGGILECGCQAARSRRRPRRHRRRIRRHRNRRRS